MRVAVTMTALPPRPRDPSVEDACPGVARLHAAADGHLARVRLPGGRVGPAALEAVARLAAMGSDVVELTSRAGLQVRGLPADCAGAFADVLSVAGLLPSPAHDRVRNILAGPLAGRTRGALAEVDGIVHELDRALCADPELARLPGRFLFAVDDGTGALAPIVADVELIAERDAFRLRLGGRDTTLAVAPARAGEAAMRAARAFLTVRDRASSGAWRVSELPDGAIALARELGLTLATPSRPAVPRVPEDTRPLGVHEQRDGRVAVAAMPPLARLDRRALLALAELARALATDVRLSPWRTLTFVDVPASAAIGLTGALEAMGMVLSDGSGWAGLSACAGLGACARALADVRAAAAQRALVRDGGSPSEHWSACERRCGEPPAAGVRVVAGEQGLTVRRAGAEPVLSTPAGALELLERAERAERVRG
jgi:precorrin-3B synthase